VGCALLAVLSVCSAAELVAAQRLEAAERRKMEEKERRLKQVGMAQQGCLVARRHPQFVQACNGPLLPAAAQVQHT
jgi:hypothetical protein